MVRGAFWGMLASAVEPRGQGPPNGCPVRLRFSFGLAHPSCSERLGLKLVHDIAYCSGAGKLLFYDFMQLPSERWHLATNKGDVRFRGHKGDQFRKGAVLTRVRDAELKNKRSDGSGVAALVEHPPFLSAIDNVCDARWSMVDDVDAEEASHPHTAGDRCEGGVKLA